MRYFFIIALAAVLITSGCQEKKPLPIIGNIETTATGDTIYPVIRDFSFINQDSQVVTNKDLLGKVTIADFFFTSCPPSVLLSRNRNYGFMTALTTTRI